MVVKEINEKYRCNVCGNVVIVTAVGGGTLNCCGEEMELVEPKKSKRSLIEEGLVLEDDENEEVAGEEKEPKEIEDYKEDLEEGEDEEEEEV